MVPAVFSASAAAASSPSLGVAMSAGLAYSAYLVGPPVFGAIASVSSLRMAFVTLLVAMAAIVALAMTQAARLRRVVVRTLCSPADRRRRYFAGPTTPTIGPSGRNSSSRLRPGA